jgi:hypothetical protein
MAWIPKGLGELPKVLAGPIVRKTTDKEVSVWLALSSSEELTLNIYDSGGQLLKSASKIPTKIGNNFYVCCINAKNTISFLSCRKPHGEGLDALSTLSDLIDDALDVEKVQVGWHLIGL